jgi:hypothetical protein
MPLISQRNRARMPARRAAAVSCTAASKPAAGAVRISHAQTALRTAKRISRSGAALRWRVREQRCSR